jgi:diacylglycerol kinase (ATP)
MRTSDAAPSRLCVIFNPTAKGERARRVLRRLQTLEPVCVLRPTVAAGTARPLATEAVAEGFDTIVAVGGDGTVNEVINGLADAPDGLARARLGVLPVGTVNVFARELGIPFRFERAWEIIRRGRETRVDLPKMEFQTAQGPQRRWFAQMAGCGLDARAVELVDWELKKRIGQFAYVASGLKALREPARLLSVRDGTRSLTGQLVLLGNGRLYGGPIPVFDRADLRDGLLDVCVFPRVNWFVILRYACAYLSPKLLRRGSEQQFQAPSVKVESSARTPVEIDGEHVGHVPAQCVIHPHALRVVIP